MSATHQHELLSVLSAYCDGTLTPDERDRLNELLRTDAAARETFVAYLDQHAQLHWAAASPVGVAGDVMFQPAYGEEVSDEELESLQGELHELSRPDRRAGVAQARRSQRFWATLSALIVAITAVALWWQPWRSGLPDALTARLVGVAGEVQLVGATPTSAVNEAVVSPGQTVRTGEFGAVQLIYPDGTLLLMQNDTELQLELSPSGQKSLRLVRGFAELRVARQPASAPLVLATPQSTIRVLGTEFRAWASDDETRIEMERGRVEVTRTRDAAQIEAVAGTFMVVDESANPLVAKPLPPQRGKPRLMIEEGTGPLVAIAYSPRGDVVASSSWTEETKLWDSTAGQLSQRLAGQRQTAKSVAFAGNGSLLAASGGDRHVSLWELPSGKHRSLPLKVDGGHSVAVSNDGQWLACNANFPGKLNGALVWRLDRPDAPLELKGHVGRSRVVAFAPHAQRQVIIGDDRGLVIVWDIAALQPLLKFQAHDQQINALALSRDGALLATGAHDHTVCVWDIAAGLKLDGRAAPPLLTRFTNHPREVRSAAFSPDGSLIVSGGGGPEVYVWDARNGRVHYTLDGHGYAVTAVAFSPQGETVATANWDGKLAWWDLTPAMVEESE